MMFEWALLMDLVKGVDSRYEKFWISEYEDWEALSGDFSHHFAGSAPDCRLVCAPQQRISGAAANTIRAPRRGRRRRSATARIPQTSPGADDRNCRRQKDT